MIKLTQETVQVTAELKAKAQIGFKKLKSREDLGFLQLPKRQELWAASGHRGKAVQGPLAVLGIGGSSLGGRAISDAFASERIEFFENVDGKDFWERIGKLSDLKNIHWAIVSKSGQTIETLGQTSFVVQYLEEKGISWRDRMTVVTEKKSNPLYDWACQNNIATLEIPIDVGGRFSVLSPVGLFPAAVMGLDLEKMRQGAEWALEQEELVTQLVAHSLKSWDRQEWVTLFWTYSSRLWTTGLWIQQLWAESLAKKVDRKGLAARRVSTPLPLIGANDQHSILQLVAEGARDKFIWFMRVKESEVAGPRLLRSQFSNQTYLEGKTLGALLAAEAQATADGLKHNQVHSLTLEIEKLDEFHLGALFMLMELVVGSLGEVLDINAFDQPGVELGKRLALDILK